MAGGMKNRRLNICAIGDNNEKTSGQHGGMKHIVA